MEYSYELKYNDGKGGELIYKFPADIDVNSLRDKLEYFLLGCSWTSGCVSHILGGGEIE